LPNVQNYHHATQAEEVAEAYPQIHGFNDDSH
jgi:hypothetical protein